MSCVSVPIFGFPVIISPRLCLITPHLFSLITFYVFISPEFPLSLGPYTRRCSCVSCVLSLKSHYSSYLSSPASFPLHDRDRWTDLKEDRITDPNQSSSVAMEFAAGVLALIRHGRPSPWIRNGHPSLRIRHGSPRSLLHHWPGAGSLICGVRRGILRACRGDGAPRRGNPPSVSARGQLPLPYGSPRHHSIVLERGDLPVSGKFPVPSRNQPTSVSAGPAQLIFVSAGPIQLIFAPAGPVQLIFVSAGPVHLIFLSAGQRFPSAPEIQRFPSAPETQRFQSAPETQRFQSAPETQRFQSAPETQCFPSALQCLHPDSALQCLLPDSTLQCLLPNSAFQCLLPDSAFQCLLPDSALRAP